MEGFAAAGLILSMIGLYAVLSYTVKQRRHEIGIRIALGARQRTVVMLVVAQGMKLALMGEFIGLAASIALTRAIAGMLFDTQPIDPLTYGAMSLLLMAVTIISFMRS